MRRALDVLLPPQCLNCATLVDLPGSLCSACWSEVRFIDHPLCVCCGVPFEYDVGPGALCGDCARQRPAFGRARAAMVYDTVGRSLVLAFKHGDCTDAAPPFGQWMVRAGSDVLADAEDVVLVPLHWTRLFARRYNQAALLARSVGQSTTGVTVSACARALRRAGAAGVDVLTLTRVVRTDA